MEYDRMTGMEYDEKTGKMRPPRGNRERDVENPITRESRKDFKRPLKFQVPNPLDTVYWETQQHLQQYNTKSLHHEHDPLLIEALNVAPTLCIEPYGTVPVVHCLVRHGLFIKLQLKMVCDIEHGWAKSTVMVRDDDRWITLESFLQGLPDPTMPGYRQAAWDAQFYSWLDNGKFFNFLELPKELQKKIFLSAIGEYIQPIHRRAEDDDGQNSICLTSGSPKPDDRHFYNKTSLPRLRPVNLALLSLNKATRATALEVLWADTTKRYGTDSTACTWFMSTDLLSDTHIASIPQFAGAKHLGFVRRIQLAYNNEILIQLFGCPVPPIHTEHASVAGPALRALPNLRSLEIHFQSAAHPNYSPWYAQQDSEMKQMYPWVKWRRLPCTKVLHEWILLWAAPDLMHIPLVGLTGYIKTNIRKKWEGIIGSNSSERTAALQQIEEEKEAVRNLPRTEFYFPPICNCPKPCGDSELRSLHEWAMAPRDRPFAPKPRPEAWKRAYERYCFDEDDEAVRQEREGWDD